MKAPAARFDSKAVKPVWRLRSLCGIAVGWKLGCSYWRAAERDEKNGFPFTAAMEWQKAAQYFASLSVISERCWREWERIVRLPRRFANPIAKCEDVVLPYAAEATSIQAIAKASGDVVPVAAAA